MGNQRITEVQASQEVSDAGVLPIKTPQTVEDAIVVTLRLGYRYLWVDKYCTGLDEAHFHTQLKQMNLVYHNSVLTIIALAGKDSSHGLPGVSRRRIGSPRVRIGSRNLASLPLSIYHIP